MAKDRFSSQKPINYHSGWKQTGSFIKPEVKKVTYRSREDQDWITFIDRCFGSVMNEWEKGFIENIRFSTFPFTEKQSIKIRDIFEKYKALHPDRLERYLS
jgi:hypothetical protein